MYTSDVRHIALVLPIRLEENVGILRGISNYEREHTDWSFFLDDQAKSVADPSWLFRRHWDGVICRHLDPRLLKECIKRKVPCVDLEDTPVYFDGVPKIRPDNYALGNLAGEHFIDRGFKHFGYCGFSSENWSVERRKGMCEAVEEVGHECSIMDTVYSHELDPGWDIREQTIIQKWIEGLPKPVAIMACNDMRALQVMEAVHTAGFKIPEDVAVIGSNNETCRVRLAHPALSSIPMNLEEWGYLGAKALDLVMEGKEAEKEVFIEPLPVIVRRSTEVLAVEDPVVSKALQIIHEEACEMLRVEELSKRVSVSRSVLERRFRKFLRKSPQEEIRSVKIAEAKKLLIETDKPLVEIAELIGFEHPEYLSVMFKRLTGEPPSEFRNKNRRPE
ncbi:MAG: XylR family transcriptional regulator [Puniceicoccaceae bacterium]